MNHIKFILALIIIGTASAPHIINSEPKTQVEWISLEKAQQLSAEDGRPLFIFVEAEWCGICKQMKRNVFPDERTNKLLSEKVYPITIDLDSKKKIKFNGNEMTEREFARSMEVQATPTMIFVDSEGNEMGRQPGFMDADQFNTLLRYVTSDLFTEISFEDFKAEG